ncbi:MAG: histidine phosphatase family protein [Oscillospiraceae bacterium]|nr:histidine phosphatase family protein [Oscillospiraceae bacterium]
MKLYVTRHGETPWNVENKICGRTDVPLTTKGLAQAESLAQRAGELDIDLIVASPMLRAMTTAQIVARHCGVPVIADERLVEQDYGIFEGRDRSDPGFLANKRHFAFRYPGGESMMQMALRVYGLLEELHSRYADKTLLLVCHGGVCRIINSYFRDLTNEEFFRYYIDNCAMECFHY